MPSSERILRSRNTKIELFGYNYKKYVWKSKGVAFRPKNTVSTVIYCGSIMFWDYFPDDAATLQWMH